ncbi:PilZ domain-containing protein [Vibrio aestuarianus]|uniref:PilZ domain-containing protein n=1 Tax=Vibrio aestuarianus TaxID=28171 RepID=UPI00237CA30A|nr:PilZ domain-containing protein [Vibrio aestuarianus]MDE1254896.1 PilZ domain-containing protein [Vibrio aestuarianus]
MDDKDFIQKRQYYRLKYPKRARPVVKIDDELFHVSEISVQGIRIEMPRATALYQGLSMSGTVHMRSDSSIKISGKVLRFQQNEVVVQLTNGPGFKHMVEEQRYIRQKYPTYFSSLRSA